MLGMHRDVSAEDEATWEVLRIEESTEGLTYYASRQENPATAFGLRQTSRQRVEFQRAFPDFPSLVVYSLEGDELCARIEGLERGRNRTQEWRLRRTT